MTNTLVDLQNRIADELLRTDLTSQIASAVNRAIDFYAARKFWFNEQRVTGVCVANNEYVAYPTGLRVLDAVFVTTNLSGAAPGYALEKKSEAEIEEFAQNVNTATQPMFYCTIGEQIRLYPMPNLAYPLTSVGVFDVTPTLVNPTDTNSWSADGQDLICARAKYTINRDVLRDPEAAQADLLAQNEAFQRLAAETARRVGTGRIRPSE